MAIQCIIPKIYAQNIPVSYVRITKPWLAIPKVLPCDFVIQWLVSQGRIFFHLEWFLPMASGPNLTLDPLTRNIDLQFQNPSYHTYLAGSVLAY